MSSTEAQFRGLIEPIAATVSGRSLDADLQRELNQRYPAHGEAYRQIMQSCRDAIAAGWMCPHEHGGIRYGRVLEAAPELGGCSVDVVQMQDVAGPHHRHPKGEIDLIMPLDEQAMFDGHPAGWLVYGPDSAHRPTVSGGSALVLYLLPEGAIEFTRRAQ